MKIVGGFIGKFKGWTLVRMERGVYGVINPKGCTLLIIHAPTAAEAMVIGYDHLPLIPKNAVWDTPVQIRNKNNSTGNGRGGKK